MLDSTKYLNKFKQNVTQHTKRAWPCVCVRDPSAYISSNTQIYTII